MILAAGLSSRAGTNKLLADLGGLTVIERTIATFRDICPRIIVVGGNRADELRAVLAPLAPRVELVVNGNFRAGMFTSVKAGLGAVRAGRCFLTPGDCPFVPPAVPARLLTVPGDIVVPRAGGRTGHPVLLDAGLIPAILSRPDDSSLRDFIAAHGAVTVDVDEQEILVDLDTPEDLKSARARVPCGPAPATARGRLPG